MLKGKLEGRKRGGKDWDKRGEECQGEDGPAGESALPYRDLMVNKMY